MALIQSPGVSTLTNAGVSNTITLSATAAGSSIVVVLPIVQSLSSGITFTVTDNQLNTYVVAFNDAVSSADVHMLVYWCQSPTAGVTTITVAATGGTFSGKVCAYETPGLASVDKTGTSGTFTTGTTTTATASGADVGSTDFVVSLMSLGGSGSNDGISSPCTGGATWSVGFVNQVGTVDNSAQSSYRFNAASTTNAATWTWSANQHGRAAIVSFQSASVGDALWAQSCL